MSHLLRDLRVRLGFSLDEVAAEADWSGDRLATVEKSDSLDELEAEQLTDLYGVDIESMLARGRVRPQDVPVATRLKAQSDVLGATTRFALARATTVARQIRELQASLGLEACKAARQHFRQSEDYSHPRHGTPARLASRVREYLGLNGPGVSDIRAELVGLGVVIIWDELDPWVDALAISAPDTGLSILANSSGNHMISACGRRMTWAHELCHLLFDRHRYPKLQKLCSIEPLRLSEQDSGPERARFAAAFGGKGTTSYEVERRARAFAAYLLAPRSQVRETWTSLTGTAPERIGKIMAQFGIGYLATRSHLHNLKLLDRKEDIGDVPTLVPAVWDQRDPPFAPTDAERLGVERQRSGSLFDLVVRALRNEHVGEGHARDLLRLNYKGWLEVRGHLGLDGQQQTWTTSKELLAGD